MHVKSNIEHNIIDVVVLAVCPLMLVLTDSMSAIYYICATAFCFFMSALICLMLNKFLNKTIKIFITLVLSTFLITLFNYFISEHGIFGLNSSNENYYAILSTIILSIDIYYIDAKAVVNHFFLRIINSIFMFAFVALVYVMFKEFLCFGTVFDWQPFEYSGFSFFETITFNFILMASVCAIFDIVFRTINSFMQSRHMAYAKLLKQIRNERIFQYDNLRRKKLLASSVELKYIDSIEYEDIRNKENKNESFADMIEKDEIVKEHKTNVIRKRKSRIKVSKEAKVQQLFDKQRKGGVR